MVSDFHSIQGFIMKIFLFSNDLKFRWHVYPIKLELYFLWYLFSKSKSSNFYPSIRQSVFLQICSEIQSFGLLESGSTRSTAVTSYSEDSSMFRHIFWFKRSESVSDLLWVVPNVFMWIYALSFNIFEGTIQYCQNLLWHGARIDLICRQIFQHQNFFEP